MWVSWEMLKILIFFVNLISLYQTLIVEYFYFTIATIKYAGTE